MSTEDYEKKVMDHLNNAQFYRKLQNNLTKRFSAIKLFLTGMTDRKIINMETFNFLKPKQARISRL